MADAACDVTDAAQVRAAIADFAARCDADRRSGQQRRRAHRRNIRRRCRWTTGTRSWRPTPTSVLIASQAAYPHLREGGGLIVNIGSFFDKLGVKRNLAYCASKAAVGAITRCLAVEWASARRAAS